MAQPTWIGVARALIFVTLVVPVVVFAGNGYRMGTSYWILA